jgi:hypothetical protein
METKLVKHASRELTELELEEVSGGRDYYLGFGIHLFVSYRRKLVTAGIGKAAYRGGA